jgi:hypothetical protein
MPITHEQAVGHLRAVRETWGDALYQQKSANHRRAFLVEKASRSGSLSLTNTEGDPLPHDNQSIWERAAAEVEPERRLD